MDTAAGSQPPCCACSKRLLGLKSFTLFTAQIQRAKPSADAGVAVTAGVSCRRVSKQSATALRRSWQPTPASSAQSIQLAIQPQTPRRYRPEPAWQVTAAADPQQASAASADQAPPGCSRYAVELRKPLGLVLEEDSHGSIYVAEVTEGGNADKSGLVSKGDQLIATSGYTYERETQYQSVQVRSGERVVRLTARGEDFSVIMAAIRSHPSQREVRLELQRC
jgi:hypothetical protein